MRFQKTSTSSSEFFLSLRFVIEKGLEKDRELGRKMELCSGSSQRGEAKEIVPKSPSLTSPLFLGTLKRTQAL